jgi:hypothetical protein
LGVASAYTRSKISYQTQYPQASQPLPGVGVASFQPVTKLTIWRRLESNFMTRVECCCHALQRLAPATHLDSITRKPTIHRHFRAIINAHLLNDSNSARRLAQSRAHVANAATGHRERYSGADFPPSAPPARNRHELPTKASNAPSPHPRGPWVGSPTETYFRRSLPR